MAFANLENTVISSDLAVNIENTVISSDLAVNIPPEKVNVNGRFLYEVK